MLSERTQRTLVHRFLMHHPLPWRTEVDWTLEVYDARDKLVIKLAHVDEFNELHATAQQIRSVLDELDATLGLLT